MAEVDFSDLDSATAWFETQRVEVRCAMSSRAALRVFANFRAGIGGSLDDLDMALLRAILTSAGRGSGRPTDVNWDVAASASPADSAFSASSAFSAAAARFAAYASASPADSAAARSAARSASSWDSQHLDRLQAVPVWTGAEAPERVAANHSAVLKQLKADPAWEFWVRFYEGMWEGTFTDWDLALEVIQIDEADWKKGYEHIGEVIAEIERGLATGTAQVTPEDVRPDNVTTLFGRAPIVKASMASLSETVSLHVDAFARLGQPTNWSRYLRH